jgi:iron complex outermembrane receptor protein
VTATTGEVGGQYLLGSLLLTGAVYRTSVRNDIFLFPFDEEGEPEGSTIDGFFGNVSRTRREGVELGSTFAFGSGASAFATYAYTRATFRTNDLELFSIRAEAEEDESVKVNEIEVGDRFPLVPAHTFRIGGDMSLGRGVDVGADVRYTGAQWLRGDEANETTPLDGYAVTSLRIGYRVGEWAVQGIVQNAFDRRYATFGTFNLNQEDDDRLERFLTPGQPRSFRLVVRRSFGRGEAVE